MGAVFDAERRFEEESETRWERGVFVLRNSGRTREERKYAFRIERKDTFRIDTCFFLKKGEEEREQERDFRSK